MPSAGSARRGRRRRGRKGRAAGRSGRRGWRCGSSCPRPAARRERDRRRVATRERGGGARPGRGGRTGRRGARRGARPPSEAAAGVILALAARLAEALVLTAALLALLALL